ncbi:hypothetical protein L1887_13010 [Cichorium endivia]|nr:hypothetical protein L1887_13010 [Cichorium endivia]
MTFPTLVVFSYFLTHAHTCNHPNPKPSRSNIKDEWACLSNVKLFLDDNRLIGNKPNSILRAAMKATLKETHVAMQTFTNFTLLSAISREQMTIEDCKELLDFSVYEIAWSLAEMKDIQDDKNLTLVCPNRMHVDMVVTSNGRGSYRLILKAINDVANYSNRRYVIHEKRRIYEEKLDTKKKKTNIMLIGDGNETTIITRDPNFMQRWTTFQTNTIGKKP